MEPTKPKIKLDLKNQDWDTWRLKLDIWSQPPTEELRNDEDPLLREKSQTMNNNSYNLTLEAFQESKTD